MSKKKPCIIKGYTYRHNGSYHVNADTTGIDDIWTTLVPANYDYENGEPTPLCVFDSKVEANQFIRKLRHDTKIAGDDIIWYIQDLSLDKTRSENIRIRLTPHE